MRYCVISYIGHFWTHSFWLKPALYTKFSALYANIGAPYSIFPESHVIGPP